MSCIGTAGHVDHGKSTLVTALTGIDPDRLAEEKARGMTIDLGFAWLALPSGRVASVVDVPGHETFIKNMLAGVGGIDVALLVVAADEGVMPQTDEHLTILDLLRVRAGVVALTKCDLVETAWLELVSEDVARRLALTTLAGAPIVPCSAITGEGLPALLTALDAALDASPTRIDHGCPRLPIDRVFTITGFGTVVTGTLQDGTLHSGQEVQILPAGLMSRVRGLQAHHESVREGHPGGRIAVNLTNVAKDDLRRGDVLTRPGALQPTSTLDVMLEVAAAAAHPIAHNAELEVYAGAAEVPARVVLLEANELHPGAHGWAQLRLRRPLVVVRGDRFIVRTPSPSVTVGGGTVVDTAAQRHRRHERAVLARLEVLARGDAEELVLATLAPNVQGRGGRSTRYGGREPATLERALGLAAEEIAAAVAALVARGKVVRIGAHVYADAAWAQLCADTLRTLAEYHQQHPLRPGMPREAWRTRLGLLPREANDALVVLTSDNAVQIAGGGGGAAPAGAPVGYGVYIKLPSHGPTLTTAQKQAVAAVLDRFRAEPFAPPTRSDVETELGPEVTALLVERGTLVKVSDAILLDRAGYDEAVRLVVRHLQTHGALTVAEARDLLHTTRKYMLALFAHLDERHITQRRGDDRVLGPGAPASADWAKSADSADERIQ